MAFVTAAAAAASAVSVELPPAGLFRGESKPDGTPVWILVKRDDDAPVQLSDAHAKLLDLQYAQGNFRRNFNLADPQLPMDLKLFFASHDIKEGWFNGAAGKDHMAFVLNPLPSVDAKKQDNKSLLASLVAAPKAEATSLGFPGSGMFAQRGGRVRRAG